MSYMLLVFDAFEREHAFVTLSDEEAVVETGASWVRRFPEDIVMMVEVPE